MGDSIRANLTYVFFKATATPTPKADVEGEEGQSHSDPREEEEEAGHNDEEEEEEEGGHEHEEERYVTTICYSPLIMNVYVCVRVIMHVTDTSSGMSKTA